MLMQNTFARARTRPRPKRARDDRVSCIKWRGRPGLRTRPEILRLVLGPYVQYCPCEALEQKLGQN